MSSNSPPGEEKAGRAIWLMWYIPEPKTLPVPHEAIL